MLAYSLLLHFWVFRLTRKQQNPWITRALIASALYISVSIIANFSFVARNLPDGFWIDWVRGIGFLYGVFFTATLSLWVLFRHMEQKFSPSRRNFFVASRTVLLGAPAIITGYGVLSGRSEFRVKEVDIPIRGLHPDLAGLRILQLSDIHLSPFLTDQELLRVIAMANETKPHLAVVTGDFITSRHDPLELCIERLSKLRADHGILGCNGNHEIFAESEQLAKDLAARKGIRILRREAETLRIGNAAINLVGVDYQPFRDPYLVGMERFVKPNELNLLLSHNPDVFPVAAKQGYDLTLAGHTHGGQVTVEILHQYANAARIFTPYVYGHYRKDESALYVTRGIGTVGVPARVGAPPEVSLIRLCAS